MATNLSNIPLQNTFRTTLTQKLTADNTSLVMYCAAVPIATIPVGQKIRVTLNALDGFTVQEDTLVSSIDTVNKTMTFASAADRGLARYNGDVGGLKEHPVLSEVIISDPYGLWLEVQSAVNAKVDKAGSVMTGSLTFTGTTNSGISPNTLTSTQRDALGVVASGTIIFNSTTGQNEQYLGGSWSAVAAGSTQPNAAPGTAGKVEIATVAQQILHTGTGVTTATLVPSVGNMVTASAGSGDSGKIVTLAANGKFDPTTIPSNAPIATLTQSLTFGENIDGTVTPRAVYQKASDGFVYRTIATGAEGSFKFLGFVTTSVLSAAAGNVITAGVVGGFSGLTIGANYYLSDTTGNISATPSTTFNMKIGRAVTATSILLEPRFMLPGISSSVVQTDFSGASTAKTASFTIPTNGNASMIEFTLTVFASMQTGGSVTAYNTYKATVDIVNQRVMSTVLVTSTGQNVPTGSIGIISTGAVATAQADGAQVTLANTTFAVTASSATSRINSISAADGAVTINYTLNTGTPNVNPGGIAISSVRILA